MRVGDVVSAKDKKLQKMSEDNLPESVKKKRAEEAAVLVEVRVPPPPPPPPCRYTQ
jgi:hypothetical protein